jgi:drug/metabolite transporter (DMT)-like permease
MSCNQAAATRSSGSASCLATHLARRATDRTCRQRRGNVSASLISASLAASSMFATILTVPLPISPAAAASYGISYVYMDRYLARRGINPVTLSACQLLAAAIMLSITPAVTGAPAPRLDMSVVGSIAILGLIGTGAAYVLNYQIITNEGATIASTVTYLLPVVAIVLGVSVLNERITLPIIAGIILILAGVALTRQHK